MNNSLLIQLNELGVSDKIYNLLFWKMNKNEIYSGADPENIEPGGATV